MRRVALGSGLDLAKLASTVRQVAISEPPPPVLVCQAETIPDAWAHLSVTNLPQDGLPTPDTAWTLMLGYPTQGDLAALLARMQSILPPGGEVLDSQAGLQATIRIPFDATPEQVAQAIQLVMVHLQRVDRSAPVELALEYP